LDRHTRKKYEKYNYGYKIIFTDFDCYVIVSYMSYLYIFILNPIIVILENFPKIK